MWLFGGMEGGVCERRVVRDGSSASHDGKPEEAHLIAGTASVHGPSGPSHKSKGQDSLITIDAARLRHCAVKCDFERVFCFRWKA